MPDPIAATPPPIQPAPHPTRAYTTLFWFLVVGQILATFTALMAVATLLATARPVVRWNIPITTPTYTLGITDADLVCDSPADCDVVYPDCSSCGEGTAVNRTAAARIAQTIRQTCQQWRGTMCLREPAVLYCTSGRCTLTPPPDPADWQTYRNESYKFEMLVPQDWVIETTSEEQQTYFSSRQLKERRDEDEKICKSPDPETRKGCRFDMGSAWDLMFSIDNREISEAMEKRIINNREWYRQATTDWVTIVAFSLPEDNAVYNFSAPIGNEEKLTQILSTFKFTR